MGEPEASRPKCRSEVLALLRGVQPELAARFGARHLALFGSAARDELKDDSDVDLLVEIEGRTTLDNFFALQDHLQSVLGRRVDLVTAKGLKPRARQAVERELVRVA